MMFKAYAEGKKKYDVQVSGESSKVEEQEVKKILKKIFKYGSQLSFFHPRD
jgi:HJR/Mrr/RecB family endonuclease